MNRRIFIFGSEWFYIKIYSGPKTLENILINNILPEIKRLVNDQIIDYFFFIRYQDPEYHIRLRLHLPNPNNINIVMICLNKLLEDYADSHIVSKLIIDTYKREIERYGDKYFNDIEKVFFYDSMFIFNYLISNHQEDEERWLISFKFIDLFLNRCDFSLNEKIDFCSTISFSLSKEIYSNIKLTNEQLNLKYRHNNKLILTLFSEDSKKLYPWIMDLNHYLDNINFFIIKYKETKNNIELSNPVDILISIIHMHINRMFRTKQRVNECVLYYLLQKHYRSESKIRELDLSDNFSTTDYMRLINDH